MHENVSGNTSASFSKPSSCVHRVNLAKGSTALRELITLDPVALASFCESTLLIVQPQANAVCLGSTHTLCFFFSPLVCSVLLSVGPLFEPADDQRSDQPLLILQWNIIMVREQESCHVSVISQSLTPPFLLL